MGGSAAVDRNTEEDWAGLGEQLRLFSVRALPGFRVNWFLRARGVVFLCGLPLLRARAQRTDCRLLCFFWGWEKKPRFETVTTDLRNSVSGRVTKSVCSHEMPGVVTVIPIRGILF
jgi:hypothetical protein